MNRQPLESAFFAASGGGANWRGALVALQNLTRQLWFWSACANLFARVAVSTKTCEFFSDRLLLNYEFCATVTTQKNTAICDALRTRVSIYLSQSRNNFLELRVSFIFVLRSLLQQHHFTFYSFVPPCLLFSKLSNSLEFACIRVSSACDKKTFSNQKITTGNTISAVHF